MDGQAKQEVERKRYREFTVTPGICGFKVRIGCSEAYFQSASQVGSAITDYMLDPQGTERKYLNVDIRVGGSLEPPTQPCPTEPETRTVREFVNR
jgi:hypothetical protein